MNNDEIVLVQHSWANVKPISEMAAAQFYQRLFELDPSLRHLFKGDMQEQGRKLMAMIDGAVNLLDNPGKLVPVAQQLGIRHAGYGVRDAHYDTVGRALLDTLAAGLGDAFTDKVRLAWTNTYQLLAKTMQDAAAGSSDKDSTASSKEKTMGTRSDSDTVVQLKGALDQSGTPIMMVDRDLLITYFNESSLRLLRKHEAAFAKRWHGFSATREFMNGACIDRFHKNPAHQRSILNDPRNLPWVTDIDIDGVLINLNVTAIYDGSGAYIGNSLEWQDVTDIRAHETKAAMLQGAIDQSGTAVMMVDNDLLITYVNKSTMDLLKQHEATFAKVWPGFRATEDFLIGNCIDMFHKNPAHQRRILGDPKNLPWKADIQIEHLTMALNVTAIVDGKGVHCGSSLEWSDVTAARANAIQVGRLQSAVHGMTTNLMMADPKGVIVYMNPAVEKMLRRREAQLRTVLPNLNVDRVVGNNFDSFHKNPAHQQGLLSNPDRLPYQSDIEVAGLEFNLTAIGLKDAEGNHLGTAVQWVDITEERDAQRQIEKLVSAANEGILDRRIDTADYQGFMKGLGDGINQMMDTIVAPIGGAIEVTQALAEGDISRGMSGNYSGEFMVLANAVNESMTNLRNMVEEIRNASGNVFSAAREIAQGNADLSQRTEAQASSLEETASAMEELTTTVQQNAENASAATRTARGAMEKAGNGGEVIRNAVSAMEEINRSSKKIADIISVIDEIAFQTNLLALNAAVEAARAGEQGRGFAVVAAEVRNLAQRSAAAAKEIKGLINDSVEAVGKGTRLVDDSGRTFGELVEAVKQVVTMIADIDNASREQSSGIAEISQAVTQMDEMTQQNAALVEQASASSKSMEEQAQALLDQVGFFRTGSETAVERKLKPVASAPAPATRSPLKVMGARSEKPKPTARIVRGKSTDEEWEEF